MENISINSLCGFLNRYRKFTGDRTQIRLEEFKYRFGHIRTALNSLNQLSEELNKREAESFNLFRLLGVEFKEVETHSVFLADLLDPQGTHCQGGLFLNRFIKLFIGKQGDRTFPLPPENSMWFIEKEKCIYSGRMDIVLSSPDNGFLIVIENKVYSLDSETQLDRYSEWLDKQRKFYSNRFLIYLTPGGDEPTQFEGDIIALSYREDISKWLEDSRGEIKSPKIEESVKQYIEIIKYL